MGCHMPITLPTFNLLCDIYTGPWLTKAFRLQSPCNLAWGRRVNTPSITGSFVPGGNVNVLMDLLLPPLTDIRCCQQANPPVLDVVEVPTGSGRWYGVAAVDDSGKGFANEHRIAVLTPIYDALDSVKFAGASWPTPMP